MIVDFYSSWKIFDFCMFFAYNDRSLNALILIES